MHRWIIASFCLTLISCREFDEWVRLLRHTPIMAPSTKFVPGSLVRVTHKDRFDGDVVCSADAVLGDDFKPKMSTTITVANTKQKSKTIKFNVDLASLAGGNVDIHAIKNIKAVVTNPKIFYVTDEMVLAALMNINRRCLFALEMLAGYNQEARNDITMISSVIEADASYTIDWDDKAGLDVTAKIAQLENLAADLHLDASRVGHQSIAAKGVYWGIQDNAYLAYLVNPQIIRRVPPNTRLITPEAASTLTTKPMGQAASQNRAGPARPLPVVSVDDEAASLPDDDADTIDATAPDFAEHVRDWLPGPTGAPGAQPDLQTDAQQVDPQDDVASAAPDAAEAASAAESEPAQADDGSPAPPPTRPPLKPSGSSTSSARVPPHLRGR